MTQMKNEEVITITVPESFAHLSVEQLLRHKWKVPKKMLHEWRMKKTVQVNEEIVHWKKEVQHGDQLQLLIKRETNNLLPNNHPLQILYEDDHLYIVNKPAGMVTHPNESAQVNTLANIVANYFLTKEDNRKIRPIHRLDQHTTGALLFAKHALSQAILDRMLAEKAIKRTYWAIICGIVKKDEGIIDQPIGRDRHHPTRRRISRTGQHAVTIYRVLDRFPKENVTLVECELKTGRTHQIRVHMAAFGHPIAGDSLYGGKKRYKRQALHARQLSFIHPFTQQVVVCKAPLLDDEPIFEKYPSS